ncbi:hypothetical protein ACROYT_G023003 [Oculina patagonica]
MKSKESSILSTMSCKELFGVTHDGKFYKGIPPLNASESWLDKAEEIGFTEDKLYKGNPPSNNEDHWLRSATLIGAAGWSDIKFLFFDPNGILYAVENGNFRKRNPPTDRNDSSMGSSTLISLARIGQRWDDYDHLFFMASGDLYGVFLDRFYKEAPTSDWLANSLTMIGHSGWSMFKFLMSPLGNK